MPKGIDGNIMTGMIYFKVMPEMEARFKAAAEEQGTTASQLGRQVIGDYLAYHDAEKASKELEAVVVS